MQPIQNVIDCYTSTAENYADKFRDELVDKHLDKILLKAFATENTDCGKIIDLGCGPGQTTAFLWDAGVRDIIGTDLVPAMITQAKKQFPHIDFETANMLQLSYEANSFGAALAFYSIVHFTYEQVRLVLLQIKRILKPFGQLLFSFHAGSDMMHYDEFLDKPVNIDFYFFEPMNIKQLLEDTGFEIIDIVERQPYTGIEFPSPRAYVWAKAIKESDTTL